MSSGGSRRRQQGGWRGRGGHHRQHQQRSDEYHQGQGKRPQQREVDENCPITKAFRGFQVEMDAKNDRFERIMKLNRDITIESKRLIFLLQRVNGSEDSDKLLEEANQKMKELHMTKFVSLARELEGQDIYQFLKAFTGGLQEYIEAVTFYHYLTDHKLAAVDSIQAQLVFTPDSLTDTVTMTTGDKPGHLAPLEEKLGDQAISDSESLKASTVTSSTNTSSHTPADTPVETPADSDEPSAKASGRLCEANGEVREVTGGQVSLTVPIPQSEYMLGVADFTGELMRLAINSVGAGDLQTPRVIADMMRLIHNAFSTFSNTSREMRRKTNVLRQSLAKVERACYTLQVRGSEIPKHMLTDVFSSGSTHSDNFHLAEDNNEDYD